MAIAKYSIARPRAAGACLAGGGHACWCDRRCRRWRGCEVQIGLDMLYEKIPAYLDFFGLRTTTPAELRALSQTGDVV